MVTTQNIEAQFPTARQVEQIGAKQLFVVHYPDYYLLVSYCTIIGIRVNDIWHISTQKYSCTTTQFIDMYGYTSVRLDPKEFIALLDKHHDK